MKILFIMLFVSSCTMLQKKPILPGNVKVKLHCVDEMLEKLSAEEAIDVCKYVTEEK